MGELTAGMLIETGLQIQMARATDGTAPELAECVVEASNAWEHAFRLASGEDEKDEPGLFEGTPVGAAFKDAAIRATPGGAEMVREEAALRGMIRTWAQHTLAVLGDGETAGGFMPVRSVADVFVNEMSERCVSLSPAFDQDTILEQEIASMFSGVQIEQRGLENWFRGLRWK